MNSIISRHKQYFFILILFFVLVSTSLQAFKSLQCSQELEEFKGKRSLPSSSQLPKRDSKYIERFAKALTFWQRLEGLSQQEGQNNTHSSVIHTKKPLHITLTQLEPANNQSSSNNNNNLGNNKEENPSLDHHFNDEHDYFNNDSNSSSVAKKRVIFEGLTASSKSHSVDFLHHTKVMSPMVIEKQRETVIDTKSDSDYDPTPGVVITGREFFNILTESGKLAVEHTSDDTPNGDEVVDPKVIKTRRQTGIDIKKHLIADYFKILGIEKVHKLTTKGKGKKITVIDGWFDSRVKSLGKVLSGSTRKHAIKSGKDFYKTSHFNAVRFGHANTVVDILATIAPKSEIRVIDTCSESGVMRPNYGGVDSTIYVPAIERAINSGAAFINLSVKLAPTNSDWDAPIELATKQAIIRATQKGIGIIIALANDGYSIGQSAYTRSLLELAKDPDTKGRVLLVCASEYNSKGRERLWRDSNYPGTVEEAHHVIMAPGCGIFAQGADKSEYVKNGTSFAAPMVTAIAAIIASTHKELSAECIFALLLQSARQKSINNSFTFDCTCGMGILNPLAAVVLANRLHDKLERTPSNANIAPHVKDFFKKQERGSDLLSRYSSNDDQTDTTIVAEIAKKLWAANRGGYHISTLGKFRRADQEPIREIRSDPIFLALKETEANARQNVYKAVRLLISYGENRYKREEIAKIIKVIREIPQSKRPAVSENVKLFIDNALIIDNDALVSSFEFFVKFIKAILEDEGNDVLEKAVPFTKGVPSLFGCYDIICTINNISPEKRDDILSRATPLIQCISNRSRSSEARMAFRTESRDIYADEIIAIIQVISTIYDEDKDIDDVLRKAQPFIQDVDNGNLCASILEEINTIPTDEFNFVLKLAKQKFEIEHQKVLNGVRKSRFLRKRNKEDLKKAQRDFQNEIPNIIIRAKL